VNPVDECCCGQDVTAHGLDGEMLFAIRCLIKGMDPFVPVTWRGRTWRVPRWYIGLHGLKPIQLPALAKKYGWELVP